MCFSGPDIKLGLALGSDIILGLVPYKKLGLGLYIKLVLDSDIKLGLVPDKKKKTRLGSDIKLVN